MKDFFFLKAQKPMWPASANVFAIRDDQGLILIEVGCGLRKFTKQLFKKLGEFNLDLKDVHTIVISHAHPDHMGAMDTVYKKLGDRNHQDLKIIINEIEKESALNIDLLNKSFDMDLIKSLFSEKWLNERFKGYFDINQNFKIMCSMSQLPADANIETIEDGDVLKLGNYQFKVLNTPGHAPGHTAFYEIKHEFLLSGDLIGEKGTAWYSPGSGGAIGYLSSLDKIEKLPIKHVFPSHGDKFDNAKERIEQIREKILLKDDLILNNLSKKPQSILELTRLLYKSEYTQMFPGVAIIESHLIKLEKENKVERRNGSIYKI